MNKWFSLFSSLLACLLFAGCSDLGQSSGKGSKNVMVREGVDSSGGGDVNYVANPKYLDERTIQQIFSEAQAYAWTFYIYATYDENFPFRQRVLLNLNEIMINMNSLYLYSLYLPSDKKPNVCLDDKNNPSDASIYPPDKRFKVCIDGARLIDKKILFEEARPYLFALFAHEISHLVGFDEPQADIFEGYFKTLYNKSSWSPFENTNNSHVPEAFFAQLQTKLQDFVKFLPSYSSLLSFYERKQVCDHLKNLSYVFSDIYKNSSIFTYDENQFLRGLSVKASYDNMALCSTDSKVIRQFENYLKTNKSIDSHTFYDSFAKQLYNSVFTAEESEITLIEFVPATDKLYLEKTMIQTLGYVQRINHYLETLQDGSKDHALNGMYINNVVTPYNATIQPELFNLYGY